MIRRAALTVILALAVVVHAQPDPTHRHLLLVLDGLRPDYVTKDVMPNLHALAQRGVTFTNHHAVYPTVTRVNASSISTGAYPERHGILGNAVFFPRVDANRFLDTGQRSDLERIQHDQDGVLLTAATLGETLRANGKNMLAVGAGTSGAVFLLNHTVAGGAILHTDYALPAPLHQRMFAELGPPPAAGHPNDARNSRAVSAFLTIGLPAVDPAVTVMWLSDPDTTAHALGMGHPTTIEALRRLDREVLNIQDGLRKAGLFDVYNIWVTSDHGFATYTGAPNVRALLAPFAGILSDVRAHCVRRLYVAMEISDRPSNRSRAAIVDRHRSNLHPARSSRVVGRRGGGNLVVRGRAGRPRADGRHSLFSRLDRRRERLWRCRHERIQWRCRARQLQPV